MNYSKLCVALMLVYGSSVHAINLKDAIVAAEKVDPALAQSLAQKMAGEENIGMTRARYLPQISAQGTFQQVDQIVQRKTAAGGTSIDDYTVKATNSQVSLRQALIRPREWLGLQVGQLQAQYAIHELTTAYGVLWQKVTTAWIDAIAAQDLYDVYREAEVAIQFASEQAKKSLKAGVGTKQAVAEAEAQLDYAKSNTLDAKLTLESKLRALRVITGEKELNLKGKHLPNYAKLMFPVKRHEEFLTKALDASPEVMASRTAEQIRQVQFKQAYSDHSPTLDLIGSYGRTNNDNINQINTRVTSASVGVQLSIPLYSGGYVQAAARQAGATANAAEAERMAVEQKITNQVDADWASQEAYKEKVKAALSLASASKEQINATRMALKAGMTSWADVGNANITWSRRYADYIGTAVTGIKTQLKLLSTLPISDDYWVNWVDQLNREASQKK